MKTELTILSVLVVLLLSGMADESFADKKIKLHLGKTIHADELGFTLIGVDDSRCPSDATCVWAGQVTAAIQIENKTHSKNIDFIPSDSYTFFSPYKIILLDVSPYPVSTEKPDDYVATLVMYSLDGTPPCERHMVIREGLCVPEPPGPLDFRETGESAGSLHAYSGLSLVGIIVGFFVIKKWKNKQ